MRATRLRGVWPSPLLTMVCAHPWISVYSEREESSGKNVILPAVFKALIWPDIVNFVHTNVYKNNRQPPMLSVNYQVIESVLILGVLADLWLKSPGFEVAGLTVLARVLLETGVVGVACLCQPRPGDVGTSEWIQHRSDMPLALHWLRLPYQCWSWLKVIV